MSATAKVYLPIGDLAYNSPTNSSVHIALAQCAEGKRLGLDRFYQRDTMLARVMSIITCPSVCPSVCHEPELCQNEES